MPRACGLLSWPQRPSLGFSLGPVTRGPHPGHLFQCSSRCRLACPTIVPASRYVMGPGAPLLGPRDTDSAIGLEDVTSGISPLYSSVFRN